VHRAPFPLAVLLVAVVAGCGGGGTKTSDIPAGGGSASTPATSTQATATPAGCTKVAKPAPKKTGGQKKPKAPLASGKAYKLTVDTNCGSFTMQLDLKTAPNASASMVSLAKGGFFDNTIFHRIVPGFVIQGGDPKGNGSGDPGYKFADELPKAGQYKIGSLAMANSGPDTNGSQFFIITGQQGVQLPPQYSLFGQVTAGMDVVNKIAALGQEGAPNGEPKQPVNMTSVTIQES
jgi:cyclophilin family peptidyl-prolyl cis-trans isomerase